MRAETEVEINRDLFISSSSVFKASQLVQLVKNLPANAGDARDVGLVPSLGRSPRVGTGNPLQYSHLGNPTDTGAWWATVSPRRCKRTGRDLMTKQQQPQVGLS